MAQFLKLVSLVLVVVSACKNETQPDNLSTQQMSSLVFPKGEKISNNNFTGNAWLQNLVAADSLNQTAVGSVTFEPGARTNWHSHPAGQIVLAIEGEGFYQEKGKPKEIIKKGEVVKCPPDIPHWHGAGDKQKFVQIAITGREKGETVWLEAVTDAEYLAPAGRE